MPLQKIGVLMDRDTDLGTVFPSRRQNLFEMLSGKQATVLANTDIYTLSQSVYVWHMWYKRAIENYFPATQFDNLGYPSASAPSVLVDWSYKNLGKISRYDKKHLSEVCFGMSRANYESNCAQFTVNGVNMSEMQLFLLKLVKLI